MAPKRKIPSSTGRRTRAQARRDSVHKKQQSKAPVEISSSEKESSPEPVPLAMIFPPSMCIGTPTTGLKSHSVSVSSSGQQKSPDVVQDSDREMQEVAESLQTLNPANIEEVSKGHEESTEKNSPSMSLDRGTRSCSQESGNPSQNPDSPTILVTEDVSHMNLDQNLESKSQDQGSSSRTVSQFTTPGRETESPTAESVAQEQEDEAEAIPEEDAIPEGDETNTAQEAAEETNADEQAQERFVPPLPEIDVTLSAYLRKLPYDFTDRKAACRYGHSKRVLEFPDFWCLPEDRVSDVFSSVASLEDSKLVRKRAVFSERVVLSSRDQNEEVLSVIEKAGLLTTVQDVEPFAKNVIVEFYSNLSREDDGISLVLIRGKMVEFSPRIINHILELPNIATAAESELTTILSDLGIISWITEGRVNVKKGFSTNLLPPLLNSLYIICCRNWIPSSNSSYVALDKARLVYKIANQIPFNFGKLIYDQICKVTENTEPGTEEKKKILPYPSLIYKIITFQVEVNLLSHEDLEPAPKEYKVNPKSGFQLSTSDAEEPAHQYGTSLAQDLRAVADLLMGVVGRLEGGDYGNFFVEPEDSEAGSDAEVNSEQSEESEAEENSEESTASASF